MNQRRGPTVVGNIVCATNYSPVAERALAAALELAGMTAARLVVLHVVRWERQRREARQALERHLALRRGEAEATGTRVEARVEAGDVVFQILETVRRERADLLFIGQHRRSDSLLSTDVEPALEDGSPVPVVEVADGDDPRAVARAWLPPPLPLHCSVCGRPSEVSVCQFCRARIVSEVLTQRYRQTHEGDRGLHIEDPRPFSDEPPRRP